MGWNYRVVEEKGYLTIRSVLYGPPDGADPPPIGGYSGKDAIPMAWGPPAEPGGETFEEIVGDLRRMEEALHRKILPMWELEHDAWMYAELKKRRQGVWWRRFLRWIGLAGWLRYQGVSWMR